MNEEILAYYTFDRKRYYPNTIEQDLLNKDLIKNKNKKKTFAMVTGLITHRYYRFKVPIKGIIFRNR